MNSFQRDRVRALQLMVQARDTGDAAALTSEFYQSFAQMVQQNEGGNAAWRLQLLTDLETLPDYDDANRFYYDYGYGGQTKGAPVTAEGKPLFYEVPESWESARKDGEHWRWLLEETVRQDPGKRAAVDMQFADVLQGQFGVQTMQSFWWPSPRCSWAAGRNRRARRGRPVSCPTTRSSRRIPTRSTGPMRGATSPPTSTCATTTG